MKLQSAEDLTKVQKRNVVTVNYADKYQYAIKT